MEWVPNIDSSHFLDEGDLLGGVFLGNLDSTLLNADIYHRFSAYGTIMSITLFKRQYNHLKTAFGFVKYITHEEAAQAIKEEVRNTWDNYRCLNSA